MSLPRYPEYKDSGVEWLGEVPGHWETLQLKRICTLKSGDGITSEQIAEEGEYPVYGGNGLRGYTNRFTHEGRYALIGRQGALCGNVNYAEGKFWASEHAVVASPTKELAITWLGELLRAMNLNQYSISAAQPGLSVEAVGNLYIPYPPFEEQQTIATFLDRETGKIDALIAEQQRLVKLLAEKRQAVISHAVTKGLNPNAPMKDSGIEWLGEVPEHWRISKLKHLAQFSGGGTPSREKMAYWNGDIPWVSPKDMKREFIDSAEESITSEGLQNSTAALLPTGRVLMVVRSGILQHTIPVAINVVPISLNQDMKALSFKVDECFNKFFLRWVQGLNDLLLLAWAKQGATVESIEHAYMAETIVPLPSIEEQQTIVAFLDNEIAKFDALTIEANRTIALLQERRSALISAAVTGKIDVRGLENLKEAA